MRTVRVVLVSLGITGINCIVYDATTKSTGMVEWE